MYHIHGKIQGLAPLLFNRMTEAAVEGLRHGTTGGKFTDEQREKEALEKVYTKEGVGLILPSWNLKVCLIEGVGKANLKEGRKGLGQFLEATLFVEGDLAFGKLKHDRIHESMGRRPPRTGGACLIKRPQLDTGWELPFMLLVVDDRRNADHIRTGLEEAGLLVGLGSWRPEYGRFRVTEWRVETTKAA